MLQILLLVFIKIFQTLSMLYW